MKVCKYNRAKDMAFKARPDEKYTLLTNVE